MSTILINIKQVVSLFMVNLSLNDLKEYILISLNITNFLTKINNIDDDKIIPPETSNKETIVFMIYKNLQFHKLLF